MRQFSFPAPIQETYEVVAVHEASNDQKFVVIAPDLPPAGYPKLIYAFVERNRFGWRAVHTAHVYDDPVADNRIITGQRFSMPPANATAPRPPGSPYRWEEHTGTDPFVLVRQDDLDPRVTTIEVTFDDGQTLRAEPVAGVYVLINPAAATPCAIRFRDAADTIVPGIAWPGPAMPHTCPPS